MRGSSFFEGEYVTINPREDIMKKIKYAGIAAATLLAVAPVTTTDLNATTVEAATTVTTANTQASSSNDIVNILKQVFSYLQKLFDNTDVDKGAVNKADTKVQTLTKTIEGLKDVSYDNNDVDANHVTDDSFGGLNTANQADSIGVADLYNDLLEANAVSSDAKNIFTNGKVSKLNVKVTASKNASDFPIIYQSMVKNGNGESFKVNIVVTDPANDDAVLVNKQITFTNNTKVTVPSSAVNVAFTTPVDVKKRFRYR